MDRHIGVVVGIIRKEGKVLIAQRKDDCRTNPGKWEFPGGKIEDGEAPEDALIREIREELDLEISPDSLFCVVEHGYVRIGSGQNKKIRIRLLAYFADWLSGRIRKIGVRDARWVRITELKDYDFAEADKEIVEKLVFG